MKTLIAITTILMALRVSAQNDRIITVADDTIACKIEAPTMFGAFKYYSSATDKIDISKARIKEFYNADKSLWFRKIFFGHNRNYFMKVLVRGKISIYEIIINPNGNGTDGWYASKNSDTAVLIKHYDSFPLSGNKKGRKLFAELLEDKRNIYDQFIEIKGSELEDMIWLAKLYNAGEHL